MKLIDKLVILYDMLDKGKSVNINITDDINYRLSVMEQHKLLLKNNGDHKTAIELLNQLSDINKKYSKVVAKINDNIRSLLRKEEVLMMSRDYSNYESNLDNIELAEFPADSFDLDFIKMMGIKIGEFSDWRRSGVDINPVDGRYTHLLLASDPVYVYTQNATAVATIKSKFNEYFAERRLRIYSDIGKLPHGRCGIVVSLGRYEFIPVDPIKEQMKCVYNLLQPGGHFLFTYNDCENMKSLALCTSNFRAYMTKSIMKSLTYGIGFDIVEAGNYLDTRSWMIVKKPGIAKSIKLSAPLVTIDS